MIIVFFEGQSMGKRYEHFQAKQMGKDIAAFIAKNPKKTVRVESFV